MNLYKLEKILSMLSNSLDIPVIWKSGTKMLVENDLPFYHRIHSCEFCKYVKEKKKNACKNNDNVFIMRIAINKHEPFVHICHAGVREIIIPFFYDNSYCGTVLIGPYLNNSDKFVIYNKKHFILPSLDENKKNAIISLVRELINPMVPSLIFGHDENILIPDDLIKNEFILSVAQYIRKNFNQKFSLKLLAKKYNISSFYLQHLFKEHTKLSIFEYIQRAKVMEAHRLIITTELPFSEIAQICSFYDQSRMSALFKRYFKHTPSHYRKIKQIA